MIEQDRAATRLGARVVRLGYADGELQPTIELRRDIVRVIREVRPDLVVTNDPTTWFRHGTYINHPDHRIAGHALRRGALPGRQEGEHLPGAAGLEPHVVGEVWLGLTDHPDAFVDISAVLAEKIDLICDHASQFPREPTEKAFTRMARETGAVRGMAAAEAFRTLRLSANTVRALAESSED